LPDLIKIVQKVAEIWRFNGFQNGGRQPSLICEIQMFNGQSSQETNFASATKFRKDRSNHYGDIAIFVVFKMAAAAIFDFPKIRNFNGPLFCSVL